MSEAVSKTIRSFLIGAAGALITYAGVWLSGNGDTFGAAAIWLTPLLNTLVDLLRRSIPVESKR